ncbi:MAG: ABC transporter ATP-binding protein [Deltaproteobacteria bacterium]|nr:ABC transporter ATP-binding protein [Deltaproteobacteria bacterium]
MPMVQCREVTKVYRQGEVEVKALRGVDLDVEAAEFMALAGPSGSGKTTLLNMIGGLDRVTSGTIRMNGNEITSMSQTELSEMRLRKIGFVFQAYNLIPVLTAIENVEFVLMLQGMGRNERVERAEQMLKEVGLEEELHRRPAELSGGQQQRVAVARAIVSRPAVVLADEPTANLDSKNGERLLDIMEALNDRHKVTFVFSTHDKMVMERARRVVRLRDGAVSDDVLKSH